MFKIEARITGCEFATIYWIQAKSYYHAIKQIKRNRYLDSIKYGNEYMRIKQDYKQI